MFAKDAEISNEDMKASQENLENSNININNHTYSTEFENNVTESLNTIARSLGDIAGLFNGESSSVDKGNAPTTQEISQNPKPAKQLQEEKESSWITALPSIFKGWFSNNDDVATVHGDESHKRITFFFSMGYCFGCFCFSFFHLIFYVRVNISFTQRKYADFCFR